jgi:dipeptidyl-peptidase 9
VAERAALAAWSAVDPRDVAESCSWAPEVPIRFQCPWSEYVVRAGWVPSIQNEGDEDIVDAPACFWLQLLDRRQRRSEFVVFPSGGSGNGLPVASDVRLEHWINVSDAYRFLSKQRGLLFCSERSGFAHLYFKDISASAGMLRSGARPVADHAGQDRAKIESDCDGKQSDVLDIIVESGGVLPGELRRITTGDDWMVEEIEYVDESRRLVYFSSTLGSPLERQLCVASYDRHSDSSMIKVLTSHGYTNSVFAFDNSGARLVVNFSSTTMATTSVVYDVVGLGEATPDRKRQVGQRINEVSLIEVARLASPSPHLSARAPWAVRPPRLFSFRADDDTLLYGAVYYPTKLHDTDPDPRPGPHPTVLVVYAGPRVQLIRNEWELTMQLKNQMLAAHGYAVIMIDGRGSYRRGIKFESVFASGFGNLELRDQVRGIEHMIAEGIVDPSRVACSGWSYGAYAGCQLLAKYDKLFRIALCGAAVTLWEGYDTAYTERYLGLPKENPALYSSSSLIAQAASFPEKDGRLLLVASVKDENVHCTQTIALVDALVQLNKPHRLLLFPKERHGLRDPAAQLHFETIFFNFLSAL